MTTPGGISAWQDRPGKTVGGALLRRVAARNPRRLRPGDVVEAWIRTDDGTIDLDVQRNKVAGEP